MTLASRRVHFVSLGCPKNRVDSEILLGHLMDADFAVTPDPEEAEIIVVNTCGFIEDAKQESVDTILEMAGYKQAGRCQRLIVAGCLVQRYAKELETEIPEIDALLGNGEYDSIADVARRASQELSGQRVSVKDPRFLHSATTPRVNTFMPHSAYVKISEGCDQKCTFCIIPKLRGLQRSRPIEDIVREAETLAERGVVELNLVAQDLTGYGYDQEGKVRLADLLVALGEVRGIQWIRPHYLYPRPFSKALLEALGQVPKIVPYVDMPLQHIADPVLKRMARGRPRSFIERLLSDLRAHVPGVVMRTSFIVGFPGETEADFESLVEFVAAEDFERVGVFKYSREEGTPSHDLPDQIPPETIESRYHRLMELLREKSRAKMESYVGRRLDVLVDGVSPESELLLEGRHPGQAPEVDGTVYLGNAVDFPDVGAGDIVRVEITEAYDYDLAGEVESVVAKAPPRPSHPRLEAKQAAMLSRGSAEAASARPSLRILS